mgnify:CR=1 FL=1
MDKFIVGIVLVVSLMPTGCSRQPEHNAEDRSSTVKVVKDEDLSSTSGGDDVELAQGTQIPKAVDHFEAGLAAYEANDLPLAHQEFLAAAKLDHADSQ